MTRCKKPGVKDDPGMVIFFSYLPNGVTKDTLVPPLDHMGDPDRKIGWGHGPRFGITTDCWRVVQYSTMFLYAYMLGTVGSGGGKCI